MRAPLWIYVLLRTNPKNSNAWRAFVFFVNPSCKYLTQIQTHQSNRRQLTPFLEQFSYGLGQRYHYSLFETTRPGPTFQTT